MIDSSRISSPASAPPILILLSTIPILTAALTVQLPRSELLSRATSACGDPSYTQCSQPGLPGNFCCPSRQTCVALAGNTTALCCPSGSDCSEIVPIPCDLSLEDKSLHPANVVMTEVLTGTLPACGAACCPFGYTCNSAGNCKINADQNAKPRITSTTMASPPIMSASSTSTDVSDQTVGVTTASQPPSVTMGSEAPAAGSASATASAAASSTASLAADPSGPDSSPASSSGSSGTQAGLIAGGVVGGITAAVCLAMLVWFCIKKEIKGKKAVNNHPSAGCSPTFGRIFNKPMITSPRKPNGIPAISKPIVDYGGAVRTDFGRKISLRSRSFHDRDDEGEGEGEDSDREYGMSGARPVSVLDVSDLHSVQCSPARITTPRTISRMYGAYDNANENNDAYWAPLKIPSTTRQFGGRHDMRGGGPAAQGRRSPGSSLSGYDRHRVIKNPNGGYTNVYSDSNSLAPPLPPRGHAADRMTSFTDMMEGADLGPQMRGAPFLSTSTYLGQR